MAERAPENSPGRDPEKFPDRDPEPPEPSPDNPELPPDFPPDLPLLILSITERLVFFAIVSFPLRLILLFLSYSVKDKICYPSRITQSDPIFSIWRFPYPSLPPPARPGPEPLPTGDLPLIHTCGNTSTRSCAHSSTRLSLPTYIHTALRTQTHPHENPSTPSDRLKRGMKLCKRLPS